MFLQQALETRLDTLGLGPLGTVTLGELVKGFDLVFALFPLHTSLVVELGGVCGGLGVR